MNLFCIATPASLGIWKSGAVSDLKVRNEGNEVGSRLAIQLPYSSGERD